MPKIHFILADGREQTIEAPTGRSVMEAARDEGVPGIIAECGGRAACSTCHVYVEREWLDVIGPAGEVEEITLDLAPDVTATSRLACQLMITPEYDGLWLRVPPHQAGY